MLIRGKYYLLPTYGSNSSSSLMGCSNFMGRQLLEQYIFSLIIKAYVPALATCYLIVSSKSQTAAEDSQNEKSELIYRLFCIIILRKGNTVCRTGSPDRTTHRANVSTLQSNRDPLNYRNQNFEYNSPFQYNQYLIRTPIGL